MPVVIPGPRRPLDDLPSLPVVLPVRRLRLRWAAAALAGAAVPVLVEWRRSGRVLSWMR